MPKTQTTDIEGGVRIAERQHVLDPEFDIAEALGARFRFAESNEAFSQINRDNLSLRPNGSGGRQRRSAAAAAAANIEY
jgi:hypothetical protein